MITPEYCRTMAAYNAWQNNGLRAILQEMPTAELNRDRGAFFGSIRGTVNHLLWADQVWLARFEGREGPGLSIGESTEMCETAAAWAAERFRTDGHIRVWAEGLHAIDLVGDLGWYSGAAGREVKRPLARLVVHMFNHQTHHRGQVHAMLTAAGIRPPDTDLFLMPEADTDQGGDQDVQSARR